MKKILLIIGLCVSIGLSAQTRKFSEIVTDGDTVTTAASTDFLYVIEDPLGTPASKAIRASAFLQTANLSPAASDLVFTSDTMSTESFQIDTSLLIVDYIFGVKGNYYGGDSLIIDGLSVIVPGSTAPDVTFDLIASTNGAVAGATVLNNDWNVTSTGRSNDVSLDNNVVPSGSSIMLVFSDVTTKPDQSIILEIYYHLQNRAW